MSANTVSGGEFIQEVISVSPGDRYEFCLFRNCKFTGTGPAEFDNCRFEVEDAAVNAVDHGFYSSCDFVQVTYKLPKDLREGSFRLRDVDWGKE